MEMLNAIKLFIFLRKEKLLRIFRTLIFIFFFTFSAKNMRKYRCIREIIIDHFIINFRLFPLDYLSNIKGLYNEATILPENMNLTQSHCAFFYWSLCICSSNYVAIASTLFFPHIQYDIKRSASFSLSFSIFSHWPTETKRQTDTYQHTPTRRHHTHLSQMLKDVVVIKTNMQNNKMWIFIKWNETLHMKVWKPNQLKESSGFSYCI